MAGRIKDLVLILIQIEEAFSRLYSNVASIEGQYNPKLKTAATILSGQEREHAKFYNRVLDSIEINDEDEIDDEIYYMAKTTLLTFRKSISYEAHPNINSLLLYAIDYEKRNCDILKAIHENLEERGSQSELDKLLTQLIDAEEKHSNVLEQFLQK